MRKCVFMVCACAFVDSQTGRQAGRQALPAWRHFRRRLNRAEFGGVSGLTQRRGGPEEEEEEEEEVLLCDLASGRVDPDDLSVATGPSTGQLDDGSGSRF